MLWTRVRGAGTGWQLVVPRRGQAAVGALQLLGRLPRGCSGAPPLLVHGFQWALPHVLADGTLVAFRLTGDAGAMLRLRDGVLDEVWHAAHVLTVKSRWCRLSE